MEAEVQGSESKTLQARVPVQIKILLLVQALQIIIIIIIIIIISSKHFIHNGSALIAIEEVYAPSPIQ